MQYQCIALCLYIYNIGGCVGWWVGVRKLKEALFDWTGGVSRDRWEVDRWSRSTHTYTFTCVMVI